MSVLRWWPLSLMLTFIGCVSQVRSPERRIAAVQGRDGVVAVTLDSALMRDFARTRWPLTFSVVLPPGYEASAERHFPAVYRILGFGASDDLVRRSASGIYEAMERGAPKMVYVLLVGDIGDRHHLFADSANNGPWSRVLVEEIVPEVERRFRVVPDASARFVMGHSSGGWSALWQQITHPLLFGGAWATAPDCVDFRSYYGADVTPGSRDNMYWARDGSLRLASRGRELTTVRGDVRRELARHGVGPILTDAWAFSPRGRDGNPRLLFDVETGDLDAEVARAWEAFDLSKRLEHDWGTIGRELAGKLHVWVGEDDEFYLNEAVSRFCEVLHTRDPSATCETVPQRSHWTLVDPHYDAGLRRKIADEMERAFVSNRRSSAIDAETALR